MVSNAFAVVVWLVIDQRVQLVAATALAIVASVVLGADVTDAKPVIVSRP
jgi:hypothetical protein